LVILNVCLKVKKNEKKEVMETKEKKKKKKNKDNASVHRCHEQDNEGRKGIAWGEREERGGHCNTKEGVL